MRVLGISGSLRADSHNTMLLRAARELFVPAGAELVPYEELKAVPPYDEDDDHRWAQEAVTRLRDAVAGADAIFISTPEYNSSVPGQSKNALDWVSRPIATNAMRNKPVVVVGASTGMFGAVWAQAELRKVLAAIGARVVEGEVAVGHAGTRFHEDGRLVDEAIREQLGEVVRLLVEQVHESARLAAAA